MADLNFPHLHLWDSTSFLCFETLNESTDTLELFSYNSQENKCSFSRDLQVCLHRGDWWRPARQTVCKDLDRGTHRCLFLGTVWLCMAPTFWASMMGSGRGMPPSLRGDQAEFDGGASLDRGPAGEAVPHPWKPRTFLMRSDNKFSRMDATQIVRDTTKTRRQNQNQNHTGLQQEGFPPKGLLWTRCEQPGDDLPHRPPLAAVPPCRTGISGIWICVPRYLEMCRQALRGVCVAERCPSYVQYSRH